MAAELESYNPQVPADLTALSRDELVECGRRVASFSSHVESVSRWALGDLACQVETSYGESELAKYAEEVGVRWSTLRDYAQVSRAFPASCRAATHSWTVYRTLAAQDDRLELVAGEKMTVAQAGALVLERQRKETRRSLRAAARERKKNAATGKKNTTATGKKKVIAGKVEPGTTATQARTPEPVAPPVTTTITEAETVTKADYNEVVSLGLGIREDYLKAAQARDQLAEENKKLTADNARLTGELEQARALISGLEKSNGQLSRLLETQTQRADRLELEAAGVTGPCTKCSEPGLPVLVDGKPGKFACETCFTEAEARGDPVSRPRSAVRA
jgi:hypothetical protein